MLDPSTERLMPLREAADSLPGGAVHVTTIHRWRKRGIRGVMLETILRGGVRYTSAEALDRFFAAATEAATGNVSRARTARQREQARARARRELSEAGV